MTYPTQVSWTIEVNKEIKTIHQLLGKKTSQKIKRALHRLTDTEYHFQIEKVDSQYLEAFIPIYKSAVEQKNGYVQDIAGEVKRWWRDGDECEAISLYQSDVLIGGLICAYGKFGKSLDAAFQVLPSSLNMTLPISVSYVCEYYFVQRAIELGKSRISRGIDGNPFGLPRYTGIGLADYKLRMGYNPSIPAISEFKDMESLRTDRDILICLGDKLNQPITEAVLLTPYTGTAATKYKSLLKQNKVKIKLVAQTN